MSTKHTDVSGHVGRDDMIFGYIRCLLWSTTGEDGEPLDKSHDADDLSPEARKKCEEDCEAFLAAHVEVLNHAADKLGMDWDSIGHDFWLTRNGHGAGFFDRAILRDGTGKYLTKACKQFKEVEPYVGDDGKVHV